MSSEIPNGIRDVFPISRKRIDSSADFVEYLIFRCPGVTARKSFWHGPRRERRCGGGGGGSGGGWSTLGAPGTTRAVLPTNIDTREFKLDRKPLARRRSSLLIKGNAARARNFVRTHAGATHIITREVDLITKKKAVGLLLPNYTRMRMRAYKKG